MESRVKNQCRRLIASMTKNEKRSFKLYAQRLGGNKELKFVRLFDRIDAQVIPNDKALMMEVADGQPGKLANLKRHLYQQILTSLRLVQLHKQRDIGIRQQIDFANVLYGKGLILDALRMLDKARDQARKLNEDFLLQDILEFQKRIEARHVTRSRQVKNKMDDLLDESRNRAERNLHTSLQATVNIQTQGFYILNGHARNEKAIVEFNEFWQVSRKPAGTYPRVPPTFFETSNRHQASMWRYYILLRLEEAKEAALDCHNHFAIRPGNDMAIRDPDFYIRNLYYVNALSFLLGHAEEADEYQQKLESFITDQLKNFNENSRKTALVYRQLCRINVMMIRHDWAAAQRIMLDQKSNPLFHPTRLPTHRRNLFRYKFAAIHFSLGNYAAALDQIQSIMNSTAALLRDDLLIHTRLMQSIAYLEVGELYLADYAVANLSRIVRRNPYAGRVHEVTLAALRRMLREEKPQWDSILAGLRTEILALRSDPYEAKCLRFFDVIYWLDNR